MKHPSVITEVVVYAQARDGAFRIWQPAGVRGRWSWLGGHKLFVDGAGKVEDPGEAGMLAREIGNKIARGEEVNEA